MTTDRTRPSIHTRAVRAARGSLRPLAAAAATAGCVAICGLIGAAPSSAASPGASTAAAHAATAAHTCAPPKYPGVGYFTSLTVTGTTCTTGNKLVLDYYKCRLKHGGVSGHCTTTVDGFTCQELRNSIPTEIDARVTCRKAKVTVVHTYQQDT